MGNHITAKNKLKTVAAKIEKTLYVLKYGHEDYNVLDRKLFFKIQDICQQEAIPFPLMNNHEGFYLDTTHPQLYCIMSKLADEFGIILNYEKIYK